MSKLLVVGMVVFCVAACSYEVEYVAEGSGVAIIAYTKHSSGYTTYLSNVSLPWRYSYSEEEGNVVLSLAVRHISSSSNMVKSIIFVDGDKKKEKIGTGPNATAITSHLLDSVYF